MKSHLKTNWLLITGILIILMRASILSESKTIRFSGYDWAVRSGHGGPGPNDWDENNVWVDLSGFLHMKLTSRGTGCFCAEVNTKDRLGFGHYQFWIVGRVDRLDPNVVFGMFNYPTSDVGPDGTNEIDIEYAQWGNPEAKHGNYTVWPVRKDLIRGFTRFALELNGNYTTHRFIWNSTSVSFQSLHGHRDDNSGLFEKWLYQPPDSKNYISQKAMPVRINLWCFKGQVPRNGQPVEIVIRSFKFTPQ